MDIRRRQHGRPVRLRHDAALRRRPAHTLNSQWHLLAEGASEHSVQGNRYRATPRSIEANTGGQSDLRGLEYGDSHAHDPANQTGLLFSPVEGGLFARPVIRLYGAQISNQNNVLGNQFEQRESNENTLRRLSDTCTISSLEAETWF